MAGGAQVHQRLVRESLEHLQAGRAAEAQRSARFAIACNPDSGFAHLLLALSHSGMGHLDEAIAVFRHAVALAPEDAQIHYNYAVTLASTGQTSLAMLEYQLCLELAPAFADALWNYGEMLRMREHFARALECFDRLLGIEGRMRPKMAHRMAVCCAYLGLQERADSLFRQQLAEDDDPLTHWEYSHFLLGCGRIDDAWVHYARRFEAGQKISLRCADYPYPRWTGELRSGTLLLLHGEQGAGDEILFSSYLEPLLARAGAIGATVVTACRPSLVRLFEASFPRLDVLPHEVLKPAVLGSSLLREHADICHAPIGDLPLWVKKDSAPVAYLRPHPDDVQYMRALLPRTVDTRLRIGIAWSSNPVSTEDNRRQRNVPAPHIAELIEVLEQKIPGIEFYSLQTDEHRSELAAMSDVSVRDMSRHLTDFSRTAALMGEMDVVVTVCTSIANLAGAMGCATKVLLQKYGDWRWYQDSTWYPHVKTYRQKMKSNWVDPLRELMADLSPAHSLCDDSGS